MDQRLIMMRMMRMSERFGIDVSHYQGDIDWKKVKDQNIDFAILKCMYEAQSHRIDETFENNYRKCGIYGIARGVYIFIGRCSIADPVTDAQALLNHLKGRPLEYGIWLDYESEHLMRAGKAKIESMTMIYADAFRAAGYHVGIYCNKAWYDNVIPTSLKSVFDFWIARYPKNDVGAYNPKSTLRPSYFSAVAWQYSSKGHVDGIGPVVDLDVDYDGVVNLIGSGPKKSYEEIVEEVLQGKWGTKDTKPTREKLLTMAGYDYKIIRKMVNDAHKKNVGT